MRFWTVHPRYLDRQRLTAAWREGLLGQKVLRGATRGYRHHPQFDRFRAQPDPVAAMAAYLEGLWEEACRRGYCFDVDKIEPHEAVPRIPTTRGQLRFEWQHLKAKLARSRPDAPAALAGIEEPEPHPLFRIVEGGVEPWERGA